MNIQGKPGRIVEETYANTSLENQKLIDVEIEAVHMILNGISNDIYFIVDACPNVKEMWIAIEQRIARNENSLALVAATQNYPDDYYQAPQAPKPYKTHAPSSRQTTSTRSYTTTRNKGKKIVKLSAEHSEWLQDTDDEPDEQELEAHYMYMEEIQEFLQATVRNREKSQSHLKYVAH
ncbi:hypothetical protein Tco_0457943 [Tanacetum coccineum]